MALLKQMLEAEEGGAKESDVSSADLSSLEDEDGTDSVPIPVTNPRDSVVTTQHDARESGCGLGGDGRNSEPTGASGRGPEDGHGPDNDGQCSEATEKNGRGLDADVATVTEDMELKAHLGSDVASGLESDDDDLIMPNL